MYTSCAQSLSKTEELLRRAHWPNKAVSPRTFEISENPLIAASQALALVAYPLEKDRKEGGPAHKLSMAFLSDMARYSKKLGDMTQLPSWAATVKVSAMRSRILAGRKRLSRAYSVLQIIYEALDREEEKKAAAAGERRTFSLRSSPDFGRMTISIPFENTSTPGTIRLTGAVPEAPNTFLKTSIISHREAFRMGSGDEEQDYVNIQNRYVAPLRPLFPILMTIWDALMSKAQQAHERKLLADEILLLQPEWATGLPGKIYHRQGQAIWMLRKLGVPLCACRMLEII